MDDKSQQWDDDPPRESAARDEGILEAGAGTDEEIDALAHGVAEAARDPATTFYQVRIHQVSGRRPDRRAS